MTQISTFLSQIEILVFDWTRFEQVNGKVQSIEIEWKLMKPTTGLRIIMSRIVVNLLFMLFLFQFSLEK